MKALLGGKGANLCEMARLGVNIPAGFTITTEVCQEFYRVGERRHEGGGVGGWGRLGTGPSRATECLGWGMCVWV